VSEAAAAKATCVPLVIGRYALFDELAAGGMATVHLGRLLGPIGFGRTVAVKRLHAHFLRDEEFITMFMDEARIVARIRHPNVVPMTDVVQSDDGLFLVMEYVHGESLSHLMRTARKNGEQIPPRIVAAIMRDVLLGLHAAHDTRGLDGALLGVVHRDVSPQNIIVGADGAARVLDFGIAKAAGRAQVTREGQIKGKLAYMAPEQLRGLVDRRADVFAASVVLWEMLVGRRLHEGAKDVDIVTRVVNGTFPPPSHFVPAFGAPLDRIVMRGLAADPNHRYPSGRDLALELERAVGLASPSEISEWVERLAKEVLEARGSLVRAMELAANDLIAFGSDPPRSSAVFAHARAPDLPAAARALQGRRRVAWFVVAVSVLLAVVGIALGVYGLVNRFARVAPGGRITPSATPAGSGVAPAGR
jgi:serine/threonine-protein kinase